MARPIPQNWTTKDGATRDDLRRVKRCLEAFGAEMDQLQAAGGGGTPDAHAASHQNGGSDEISVAGLSGQLADGQRASALVTTGSDVVVSGAAAPSSGQVLTATGTTTATWQTPAADTLSEIWALPASPHANDQEFTGSSLPSGWAWWGNSTLAVPTILGTPAPLSTPFATANSIRVDYNARRSWVRCAPNNTGEFFLLYRSFAGAASTTYRARLSLGAGAGGLAISSEVGLFVSNADNGGPVARTAGAGAGARYISVVLQHLNTPSMFVQARQRSGGGASNIANIGLGGDTLARGDIEVGITFAATGTTYSTWVRCGGSTHVLNANTALPSTNYSDFIYAGVFFNTNWSAPGRQPVSACDYVRFENTDNPVI